MQKKPPIKAVVEFVPPAARKKASKPTKARHIPIHVAIALNFPVSSSMIFSFLIHYSLS